MDHAIIVRAQSKAISSRSLKEMISKLERTCDFTSDLSTLWPLIDILNLFVITFPLNSLVNCHQNQSKVFVIGLVMKSQFQFLSEVNYGFMEFQIILKLLVGFAFYCNYRVTTSFRSALGHFTKHITMFLL